MNMSYCRFQNTRNDLIDCLENMNDEDLAGFESRARTLMFEEIIGFLQNNGIEMEHEDIESFSKRFNLELQL